jgi:hypothetical protein
MNLLVGEVAKIAIVVPILSVHPLFGDLLPVVLGRVKSTADPCSAWKRWKRFTRGRRGCGPAQTTTRSV